MKNALKLSFILFLFASCNKVHPVPTEYYGYWKAETTQMLTTKKRMHTLKITPDYEGGAEGRYTSSGDSKLLDEDVDGRIKIEDNIFKLRKKEFKINSTPKLNEEGKFEMQLGSLKYTKF